LYYDRSRHLAGCGSYTIFIDPHKGQPIPGRTIEEIQAERTDEWMAISGVQGVASACSRDTLHLDSVIR